MLGGYYGNFPLMLVGRVVFGLGGESMSVAQSSIVSIWFKGAELNFALGANVSLARLGSVLNSNVLPTLYAHHGLGTALLVGFAICCFSLICAFVLVVLDKIAEKKNPDAEKAALAEDEKFKFSDIYQFKTPFWLLTGSCVVTYMSVFPYIQVVTDLLQKKYGFDPVEAGTLMGVPYLISAFSSPVLGLGVDKIGRRAVLISCSSLILISAYLCSMLIPACDQCHNELYPLVLTGIGYSIYASAIWGSIPYVVSP
jgi:nitrate/nitrite transporter NarK